MDAALNDLLLADRRIPAGGDWLGRAELEGLTPDGLITRMHELAPFIAANAQLAEELRRPVDEVWAALRASGIFYLLVPKCYGGLEFGVETFIDATLPVAEACASTGWAATFCVEHNWMLCQFPEEGQVEIFSKFPYIIAPAAASPPGAAIPVEGGYRVSGRWKWGTGVMHADWVMLSVMTPGETPARMRMAAIPADQVKVIDVWQVAGMAGTGSNDILAEDVFVPSRHMADFDAMRDGAACGATLHANPLYAMPMLPFLYVGAAIPALGAARRAVASFRSNITDRMVRGTDLKQQDKPAAQMRLARATLTLQTAELLLRDIARRNMTLVGAGPQNVEARIEMRAQGAHVVELCREAVRTVVEASGASVHFLNHPMQRALRDIQVISGHIVFDMDSGLEMLGRSMIGLKPVTPALF